MAKWCSKTGWSRLYSGHPVLASYGIVDFVQPNDQEEMMAIDETHWRPAIARRNDEFALADLAVIDLCEDCRAPLLSTEKIKCTPCTKDFDEFDEPVQLQLL